MKHTLVLFFVFISSYFSYSQSTEIKGSIVEGSGMQPVAYATVIVKNSSEDSTLAGTTTDLDGVFSIMTDASDFVIEVSFIGFETTIINDFTVSDGVVDLGVISLDENSTMLDEVEVRAEKSTTEFKLDKRVFNVGKDLSSTGASALEVLNNVPSVNVNIEGQISLRGSQGVQVLINGKPSVIASESGNALGTITAEMIDKIEVITNPSAKYEAEGTAGIINIVIKKEERKGINGSATINVGAPHNHSFGLSLNRRTEKFNLFSQLGVGYREYPIDVKAINRDLRTGATVYTDGREYRNENFYNLILGTDYHINTLNVLTLSGSFAYEIEDQPSNFDFRYEDANGTIADVWHRSEVTEATNPKYQYELQYKKDFEDDEDHMLLFSAIGNLFAKDQSSNFLNTASVGETFNNKQRTRTDFGERRHTFKLDYTKPYDETWTLEVGAQYALSDVRNDYEVSNLLDDIWTIDPNLTNVFEYQQNVLGVYSTGAYEGEKWGVKLGLRVENTELNTLLATTGQKNDQNFTNVFPTVHTSYKFTPAFSLQAGYSRRIFRPRMWDLNPFFNIRNNFSIRTGNPEILPEYSDSYEVTGIYVMGQLALNFGVFHRYTTDVVERIATFSEGIGTTKPFNVGTNKAVGFEANGKITAHKNWTITGDFNYNYFKREGTFESQLFNYDGDQWFVKLTNKLKLPHDIDVEVTGHYRSQVNVLQGKLSGNIYADLGLRKKIIDGKGVLNFSVRDIFLSRFRESELYQPDFYLYSFGRRGRFLILGFSYGFGKGEAMEFSGHKRHH